MIVEHFREGDPLPVYRRFHSKGRMAPAGLSYVSSWVDSELKICYQLMETEDLMLLEQWMKNWEDLVEFEVRPVITSQEASARITDMLSEEKGTKDGITIKSRRRNGA